MAVKKGILDNFLKPSSHYTDNQKNLRSIFIDKSEDDLKPDPQNFLEASILEENNGPQLEHIRNTSGTQLRHNKNTTRTHQGHNWDTEIPIGTQ
jgi:hypothetical protein